MNNNNNRQSINNYVYNRRRNREPEPVQNDNEFDFTNQNNDSRQENPTSSMYNSYVSENDYNSYTSGYQTSYTNSGTDWNQPSPNTYNNHYTPPSQNTYNDYSQPSQNSYNNNFNNYNQPPQNSYNNFNGYNQPPQNNQSVWQTDFGNLNRSQPVQASPYQSNNAPMGHNAVEIPLRNKTPLSTAILLAGFGAVFVLMIGISILSAILNWTGNGLMIVMMIIFFGGFFTIAFAMAFGSNIDRRQNLKVCKTQVKGRLVGYAKERRSHKGHHYSVYAPKYEMFINNRYEIRTINLFERGPQNWGDEINLLVNPDGYEAIPATKADFPKTTAGDWIAALVMIGIIVVFFLGPLILSLIH